MPVSSSRVMKVTLPAPGRWRTRTMPATWTLRAVLEPLRARRRATMPRRSSSGAQEGERMGAQRELDGAIILDHLAALGQRRQRHLGLAASRASAAANKGSGASPSPRTRHRAWRRSRPRHGRRRRRRASPAPPPARPSGARRPRPRRRARPSPRRRSCGAMVVGEALHHAQAEAERRR